ncbi:unnamed protein product [Mytilus coruscus]|uniref:DZIP3-like HEPN domain-containing protein n=1 Tax=Mytilus coruscus TaxID=42192 RepID=A0A6J8CX57_MYTCO|nr:unnamed protein product [Mytilus coruscus]
MENFVRMFMLLVEVAVGVIRAFLEDKIKPDNFESFLQQHRHDLYHLCYNRGRCCSCGLSPTFPTQAVIRKAQLDILFVQRPGVNCSSNSRVCSCSYIATPNIQLNTIDITLCFAIINNFITLDKNQNDFLNDIRVVRNEISHFAHQHDITSVEFDRMWKKVIKASIHLATCINNTYSADIQDKIERLRTRPILAVEYTESLREIVKWINGNEENRVEMDETLKRIETKIDGIPDIIFNLTLKCQKTSNEDDCELPYSTQTQPKIIEDMTKPLKEGESRYFRIYTEIEKFRQEGDRNKSSAEMFAVLVYIVLHGSSSVKEIDVNVVQKISKAIFHQDVSCDLLSIERCIHDLTPKYLEQIGDRVTTRDAVISKAVICFFRNECFGCFVEISSILILVDHILPSEQNDECHFAFDAYSLVLALIKRLQCNPDVVHIGQFIQTLVNKLENIEIVNLFLDVLKENGLTSKGANFKVFEKQKRFYELLYRTVDDAENVVFHIIVMHYVEYERFKLYIEYICENRPDVMQVKNKSEFSPLQFAGFLGNIEIIGIFMCNSNERDEKLIEEIRSSVKSGIVILERLNSSKLDNDDDDLKKLKLGKESDYFCILDLIGNDEKETDEMDLLGNDVKETEEMDFSKLIGDSIVEVITDFKKGLNAFTKIPNIFKTINKATKLKDEEK